MKLFKGKSQKGFTLVELLIVIAVLGVLAVVAIPNLSSFINSANVVAANTEASNVRSASQAYIAYSGDMAGTKTSTDLITDGYLSGTLKATYTIEMATGKVTAVTYVADGWDSVIFDVSEQKWIKHTYATTLSAGDSIAQA